MTLIHNNIQKLEDESTFNNELLRLPDNKLNSVDIHQHHYFFFPQLLTQKIWPHVQYLLIPFDWKHNQQKNFIK